MHNMAMSVGTSALVVKEVKIDEEAVDTCQVHIVARRQGIIAWLLTLMGIDVMTVFEVYRNRIEFSSGSLSGKIVSVMPLSSMSVATTGFTKPILLLVVGLFWLLVSLYALYENGAGGFFLALLPCLLSVIFYYLRKSLIIMVTSHSGFVAGFAFKTAVIEGVSVNYELAQKVIGIINDNLVRQTARV